MSPADRLPTTWFLDSKGRKAFQIVGMIPDMENEYVARLEMLRSADEQQVAAVIHK